MMHKMIAFFISSICSISIAPMIIALPLIAHQNQTPMTDEVGAMIHVDPDDMPHVGKPSLTWFMLSQNNGEMIAPENCDCRVMVYDAENEAIAHHLPLSVTTVEEQPVLSTMITFPSPGVYTVVLSGESENDSFEAFELRFPITAVNP
jgi:hypothetical protein